MTQTTDTKTLAITADAALENAVVLAKADGLAPGLYAAERDGAKFSVQVSALSDGAEAAVYVPKLAKGESVSLELTPVEPGGGRGIDLLDQPENGRIVVNYSGFLQTIYHYGAMNFKPRFYPVTAPCARMGGIEDPQTVYPKSITQDSPTDHIWHRSLWYACGEVNGTDFYLENGGEGRIVHKRFVDLYSGPVCGGFREELRWTTPAGKELIHDERTFAMYRLKGMLRVFDIGARFTALDEEVEFGQTNENALPLIRVADMIDEWDGGRITLGGGLTGGKAAFGQRAAWGDCSGPLVKKEGEPDEWWGIAMLDHSANRNHPNAWFARSYGPLGTNLPFFDGPLKLARGETWELRHRIVVHPGDAETAGIARHFEQYAANVEATFS